MLREVTRFRNTSYKFDKVKFDMKMSKRKAVLNKVIRFSQEL
jgi:hypothetical protein